jgi:hypothetical protein
VTIIRVGATKKYSEGWESAFGKGKKSTAAAKKPGSRKTAAKATAGKSAAQSAKKKSPAKKGKK